MPHNTWHARLLTYLPAYFHRQRFGVTWEPEVSVRPISDLLGGASEGLLCLASDGFWDHWTFEDSVAELCSVHGLSLIHI